MTLKKTVTILTFGALQVENKICIFKILENERAGKMMEEIARKKK